MHFPNSTQNEVIYNLGHNILELCNFLVQIRLTTSKAKRDMYCSRLDIRVASRVAERLKTYKEILKIFEKSKEILEKSQIWVEI